MHFVLVAIVFVIFFNVFMWIFFFRKFNNFFSTDEIINATNDRAKEIIKSINNTVGMSINLIEDRIAQLKSISAEAEESIELLNKEILVSEKSKKIQQKLSSSQARPSFIQGDLFFRNEVSKEKGEEISNIIKKVEVEKENPSSTPSPDFFVSKNLVVVKKSFNAQVKEFYLLGLSVDEIASKTGRSVQEVRLAIDLI